VILITGGAGYIGSHVNKGLSHGGHETLVFDNLSYGHKELARWGVFVQGDLADKESLRTVFRKYPIDAVMHFAAFAYVGESVVNPGKYYANNVCNAVNLLEVMLEHNIGFFILSSTCATYGDPELLPITEDHPQRPLNPYGRTKLMVEQILKDYDSAYGMKHVSLRYFNAAGADMDAEAGEWHEPETHLIPLVLDTALGRSGKINIFGTDYNTPDGTCVRDYIHVSDLAEGHILALDYLLRGGESRAFNLGNGNGYSVKEVIETARQVTKNDIKAVGMGRRPGDPAVLVGSSRAAKDILGWAPKYYELPVIIESAWAWHKQNAQNRSGPRHPDI